MDDTGVATGQQQLDALEAALARLRAEHDLLLNRFEFDAARALVPRIAAAERERAALGESRPPLPARPPVPFRVKRRRRR
jgi:hypothetical protein